MEAGVKGGSQRGGLWVIGAWRGCVWCAKHGTTHAEDGRDDLPHCLHTLCLSGSLLAALLALAPARPAPPSPRTALGCARGTQVAFGVGVGTTSKAPALAKARRLWGAAL